MVRKETKTLTEEKKNLILRLSQDESMTMKRISLMVDINVRTVASVIRGSNNPHPVITSSNPVPAPPPRRDDQVVRNIVACHNDLTLTEISEELYTRLGVKKSNSTICRKLKKLGITRKRLSLIPEERNSQDKIDKRSIYASAISQYSPENLVFWMRQDSIAIHRVIMDIQPRTLKHTGRFLQTEAQTSAASVLSLMKDWSRMKSVWVLITLSF